MTTAELLVAGHCRQLERFTRRGGAWWPPVEFPSSAALLRRPDGGLALFDTGYAPRFRQQTARGPYLLYRLLLPVTCRPQDAVAAQLRNRGLDPAGVDTVLLSHLHGDHVAGLRDFPNARIVLGRGALPANWRGRAAGRNARHGFVPALLPDDLEQRLVVADGLPTAPTGLGGALRHGHRVFGDDTALAVPLPGHVPGHLGLWLPHAGPDGLLLAGDACWTERAYTCGELPARWLLRSGDERAYRRVVAELARLHRERPRLLIVPAHCWPSIRRARRVLGG